MSGHTTKRILKKWNVGSEEKKHYYLRGPGPKTKRAKFSIIERSKIGSKQVKSEALDSINLSFQSGRISLEEARKGVKDLVNSFQSLQKSAIQFNQDNLKLLEKYWEAEYSDRDISSPYAARSRLERAVTACGHYSIQSASREELQNEIDRVFKGNRQRDAVAALNQILKWLKRDVKLRKQREEIKAVAYIKIEEYRAKAISNRLHQLVCDVAIGSGLRLGEVFAVTPESLIKNGVIVRDQMDQKGIRRNTKTRRERRAVVIAALEKSLKEWANVPKNEKEAIRSFNYAKLCQKTWGVKFHDLRHSYAIHLIRKGVSLFDVSRFLGNSVAVCEKYYVGFETSSEMIDLANQKLSNK